MQDIEYLRSKGVSSGAWKKIFSAEPTDWPPRIKKLVELLSNRTNDGFMLNLQEWRAYHAIDLAYDADFKQTTPTFVRHLLSQDLKPEAMLESLKAFGLSEETLFMRIQKDGKEFRVLNEPIFFQIFVPIVKAYVGTQLNTIFNERNTTPILPFRPLKETPRDRVLCEIWSDLVNEIGTWYGYAAVKRQAIHQMLKYGIMLAFPREEWHYEEQIYDRGDGPKRETVKEGLRYNLPHPTRMFYDLSYPLTSLNTDTGCEFAGHWTVKKWGEILDNRMYWNRRKIFAGTNWFDSPLAGNYFQEVYPCTLKFPVHNWGNVTREDKQAWYNTATERDMAVFVTEQFMRLRPRDWGLGDYPYPVWCRFTLAGADTVIWAEPSAYTPPWFMGYDYDENAGRNSSLALELIPWQDHLGMILSQMLLTAKQNLANVIFYNNQAVDKADIERIINSGEKMYRGMNFLGFDALQFGVARIDVDKIFHNIQFNRQDISQFLQMVPMLLSIMERVLRISAQAAGAAASHQQSKEEIIETGSATSNRTLFTASYVDEGLDAMRRQNHDAALTYMDPDVEVQISSNIPDLQKVIRELGFKVLHAGPHKTLIKGKKKGIRLESFAAANTGPTSSKDVQLSQVIWQTVGVIAGQEKLFAEVGAPLLLKLVELGMHLAGVPPEIRLEVDPNAKKNGEVPENVLEAIKQAQQITLQAVEQKIAAPVAQKAIQTEQEVQQLQAAIKQLEGIYQVAAAQQQKVEIEKTKTAVKLRLKAAEAEAAEKRKDEALARAEARADAQAAAKIKREATESRAKVAIKTGEAAHGVALEAARAASEPAETE
jgi:hypothetical protein